MEAHQLVRLEEQNTPVLVNSKFDFSFPDNFMFSNERESNVGTYDSQLDKLGK